MLLECVKKLRDAFVMGATDHIIPTHKLLFGVSTLALPSCPSSTRQVIFQFEIVCS